MSQFLGSVNRCIDFCNVKGKFEVFIQICVKLVMFMYKGDHINCTQFVYLFNDENKQLFMDFVVFLFGVKIKIQGIGVKYILMQ